MGGYGSSTNELRKLRKLARLIRVAFGGRRYSGEPITKEAMILHCQQWPGSNGHYTMNNSTVRDILITLDELDQMRAAAAQGTASGVLRNEEVEA